MLFKLVIDEVPGSVNHPDDDLKLEGNNRFPSWDKLSKYKKRWERYAKAAAFDADLPEYKHKKLEVKFKFYHPTSRKRDHDNYFIVMKGMVDGLFDEDDSQVLRIHYPDFLKDKEDPRVEIVVSEWSDGKN